MRRWPGKKKAYYPKECICTQNPIDKIPLYKGQKVRNWHKNGGVQKSTPDRNAS